MINEVSINNYKTIKKLQLKMGCFNVLIGENGSGKSNFLEAIASYSAALANKLSNEFMLSRGVRVVDSSCIFSKFQNVTEEKIEIFVIDSENFGCSVAITYDSKMPFSPLKNKIYLVSIGDSQESKKRFNVYNINEIDKVKSDYKNINKSILEEHGSKTAFLNKLEENIKAVNSRESTDEFKTAIEELTTGDLYKTFGKLTSLEKVVNIMSSYHETEEEKLFTDFVIYSPELSKLRIFSSDSQIEPLGINGEGLLKLLQVMKEHELDKYNKVLEIAGMFQWVQKISVDEKDNELDPKIKIIDRFMGHEIDHRSANEGFLFVLFYAALFSSKFTPQSFAVDNIDASLNPKLCRVLINELIKLAKENGKQAFVTTHNPAILDGLDLHDDDQRLFVVERKDEGDTTLRRVGIDDLPKPTRSGQTIKLSEAFMRGLLGGLPTNF